MTYRDFNIVQNLRYLRNFIWYVVSLSQKMYFIDG